MKLFFSIAAGLSVIVMLFCSIPAHARKPKAFDKYDPPAADLILALPDPLLISKNNGSLSNLNLVTGNTTVDQTSVLKTIPVNVKCNVDVIQNTLDNVPLTSRIFGGCGLNYHY